MTELNALEPARVTVDDRFSISIPVDSTNFGTYTKYKDFYKYRNGYAETAKIPLNMKFRSFEECLKDPNLPDNIPIRDYEAMSIPETLHIGLNGILGFYTKHNRLPYIRNDEEAKQCLEFAQNAMANIKNPDKVNIEFRAILLMSRLGRCEITPMTSFIGGVASQEVLKYVGKYTPLNQWLFFDMLDTLPDEMEPYKEDKSRYSDYTAIYGEKIMNDIKKLKIFMIGAGALGCELVKGYTLMGACCSPEGHLDCTDNDLIEWTNLNRQFLFKQTDVGKSKSESACRAGKEINKDFNFTSYKDLVNPDTEYKFNCQFWESKDLIMGAVDNMEARRYVNAKCLWYSKTYLDSGTKGPSCNNLDIIKDLSKSYTSIPNPDSQGQFPMCTIKNFPTRILHTIEWARGIFNDCFATAAQELQGFMKNTKGFIENIKKTQTASGLIQLLERMKSFGLIKTHSNLEECIAYARQTFDLYFRDRILSLLKVHPLDEVENGTSFWSITRRPPTSIEFDSNNEMHNLFILSFVKLLFRTLKLEFKSESEGEIKVIAKKISSEVKIISKERLDLDDNPIVGVYNENDMKIIEKLIGEIEVITKGLKESDIAPGVFEKDDDLIIDLVHTLANIRAANYNIKQCDKQETKFKAGNIIPAMATTTAMIIGQVLVELLKVAQGFKDLNKYRALFINSALNFYWINAVEDKIILTGERLNEALNSPTIPVIENQTEWDKIEINGPIIIEDFVNHIKTKYNIDVTVIGSGPHSLYRVFSRKSKEKVLKMEIKERFEQITGRKLLDCEKYIEIEATGSITIDRKTFNEKFKKKDKKNKTENDDKKEEDPTVKCAALIPKFKYIIASK